MAYCNSHAYVSELQISSVGCDSWRFLSHVVSFLLTPELFEMYS
jgi:hypothetical protein